MALGSHLITVRRLEKYINDVIGKKANLPDTSKTIIGNISQINSDLTQEVSRATSQDNVLSARIDRIASLPSGSTSGDAELMDIRVGANGVTYPSAGDAVRGQVTDLNNTISDFNSYDAFANISWPNHDWNGIKFTWDGERYTATGTASANSNFNLYAQATAFPDSIVPGDLLTFYIDSTLVNVSIQLLWYQNGAWDGLTNLQDGYQVIVPTNATGMVLRFYVASGATISGTCCIKATKIISNESLNIVTPVVLPHNTLHRTDLIQKVLDKYGTCQLAKGTYKIGTIQMPDNSILRGLGDSTIIQVDGNTDGIKVGANCTIENVRITCSSGHTTDRGTGSGIVVQGNYENAPFKHNTKLSNVTVDGFACAGIRGVATGYWVANSISAVNCKFVNCWCGILLEDFCEFNRFTNCLTYSNYIGACIYSGNNVLVNCSLSNNTVGLYLIGTGNLGGNNGHGAVIGCTINHSNNNTGYAVIAKGIENGFIIEGCNIWYGKVFADTGGDGSTGLLMSNCLFGGGTPEIINRGADALILSTCIFKATPTFTGNKTTIKTNCYMYDGTVIE